MVATAKVERSKESRMREQGARKGARKDSKRENKRKGTAGAVESRGGSWPGLFRKGTHELDDFDLDEFDLGDDVENENVGDASSLEPKQGMLSKLNTTTGRWQSRRFELASCMGTGDHLLVYYKAGIDIYILLLLVQPSTHPPDYPPTHPPHLPPSPPPGKSRTKMTRAAHTLDGGAGAGGGAVDGGASESGLGGKGREAITAKYSRLGKRAKEQVSEELLAPPQRQGYLDKLSGGKANDKCSPNRTSPTRASSSAGFTVASSAGFTVDVRPGQKWQRRHFRQGARFLQYHRSEHSPEGEHEHHGVVDLNCLQKVEQSGRRLRLELRLVVVKGAGKRMKRTTVSATLDLCASSDTGEWAN
jgi:hypothetical protein